MAHIKFERHLSRFEIQNQCILLEDDLGNNHQLTFRASDLFVRSKGKHYDAMVRDFYYNGKFKQGISFPHEAGHICDFFFDQSASEAKRVKFDFDPDEPLVENKMPIDIEIYFMTK
jgi:hypothetical protein